MNLKKQQGFTLIELMIVIAIIAVLAAIALPAYADYLKRTKVSEAIVNVSASRTGIAEYVASYGKLPGAASFTPDGTSTQYVAAGTSWDGTKVTATVQNIPNVSGTITLTPSNVASSVIKVWTCSGTVPAKYRPATCQ